MIGTSEVWTADSTVSAVGLELLVFSYSWICPCFYCSLCHLWLHLPGTHHAQSQDLSWQLKNTKFPSLHSQSYVKKALSVGNNMWAGTQVRYLHGQLSSTLGWNVFAKVLVFAKDQYCGHLYRVKDKNVFLATGWKKKKWEVASLATSGLPWWEYTCERSFQVQHISAHHSQSSSST